MARLADVRAFPLLFPPPLGVLLACVLQAGCAPGTVVPVVGGLGAEIAIFHRSVPDIVYSAMTGRDCSVVRLDRGEPYCRAPEPEPPAQPYCTRSLAVVDCWSAPEAMHDLPPQVAEGPTRLTPAQERNRTRSWLDL